MNLYELQNEYVSALNNIAIDETTGEVIGMEMVEKIEGALNEKASNAACYIKSMDALIKAIKDEEKTLKERREQIEKKTEALKDYIEQCMVLACIDKIETAKAKISFRSSTSVSIDDQEKLPPKYVKITMTTAPDKTAIGAALKAGEKVEGASLLIKQNLQIK